MVAELMFIVWLTVRMLFPTVAIGDGDLGVGNGVYENSEVVEFGTSIGDNCTTKAVGGERASFETASAPAYKH